MLSFMSHGDMKAAINAEQIAYHTNLGFILFFCNEC